MPSNVHLIIKQIVMLNKYVYLSNKKASEKLKSIIKSKSKILSFAELIYINISI